MRSWPRPARSSAASIAGPVAPITTAATSRLSWASRVAMLSYRNTLGAPPKMTAYGPLKASTAVMTDSGVVAFESLMYVRPPDEHTCSSL